MLYRIHGGVVYKHITTSFMHIYRIHGGVVYKQIITSVMHIVTGCIQNNYIICTIYIHNSIRKNSLNIEDTIHNN